MSDELKLPPSKVATGKGDAGTTGLLFGGDRISKDDVRTEAYGTIDEADASATHRVISAESASVMTDLMRDVVCDGTASRALET